MRCFATQTLTCIDRYAERYLMINGDAFQYAIYRDGLGDKLYLTVHWRSALVHTDFRDELQCQAGTETYAFEMLAGWEDPVCVLPVLTDENGQITGPYNLVPKKNAVLYYDRVSRKYYTTSPKTYRTLPTMHMTEPVMAANYQQTFRWTLHPGDNRSGWAYNMELRYRNPGAGTYESVALFTDTKKVTCTLDMDIGYLGKEVCFVLEYRTYGEDWPGFDSEDFTTLNRLITPWKLVERNAAIPLPPQSIGVSMLLAGGRVTVQWSAVSDPLNAITAYRLERAVAGPDGTPVSFVQLYTGRSTQFRDTLPGDAGTVRYRVCAVNRAGTASPWTETGIREIAQSNLYVCRNGTWVRAAGVWIGQKRASPMVRIREQK